MRPSESWFLYLLECARGKLYIGISPDVEERFRKHQAGKGAFFTRVNRPIRILAAQEYRNKSAAARAEAALKKMPRAYKFHWAACHGWSRS